MGAASKGDESTALGQVAHSDSLADRGPIEHAIARLHESLFHHRSRIASSIHIHLQR